MPLEDEFCKIILQWRAGEGDAVLDMPELWITALAYLNYLMLPRGTPIGTGEDQFLAIGNSFASVKAFQAACSFYFGRIMKPSPIEKHGQCNSIYLFLSLFHMLFNRCVEADCKLANEGHDQERYQVSRRSGGRSSSAVRRLHGVCYLVGRNATADLDNAPHPTYFWASRKFRRSVRFDIFPASLFLLFLLLLSPSPLNHSFSP